MENENFYLRRGDVIWIAENKISYIGNHIQTKPRPAIIISNDKNNEYSEILNVVPLTSKLEKKIPSHCLIRFLDGKNIKVNKALCEQITTIPRSYVKFKISRISPEDIERLEHCIKIQFGMF